MMLCFVPPRIEPTVTTAGSNGEFSRLTIVCKSMTSWARLDDRVDRRVRISAMSAFSAHRDIDAVDVRQNVPRAISHLAGLHVRIDVQRERIVGLANLRKQAVLEHLARPRADLLGGLADEHDGSAPGVFMRRQIPGGPRRGK